MKKLVIFILTFFVAFNYTNAQLKMDEDGSVAIEATPAPNNYTKTRVVLSTLNHDGVYWNFAFIGHNNPPSPQNANDGRYNVGVYGSILL